MGKIAVLICAAAATALLVGCAGEDDYYGHGDPRFAYAYDGYYDGYYGTVFDGYWGHDGDSTIATPKGAPIGAITAGISVTIRPTAIGISRVRITVGIVVAATIVIVTAITATTTTAIGTTATDRAGAVMSDASRQRLALDRRRRAGQTWVNQSTRGNAA